MVFPGNNQEQRVVAEKGAPGLAMHMSEPAEGLPGVVQDVMTIGEVAAFLRIPRSSVYKLAQTGTIPCRKAGRHWRFSQRALRSWLETGGASCSFAVNGDPPSSPHASLASGHSKEE